MAGGLSVSFPPSVASEGRLDVFFAKPTRGGSQVLTQKRLSSFDLVGPCSKGKEL